MPRLTSTYMLCVALGFMGAALFGCSEDEDPKPPVDARPDVAGACVPADCQAFMLPPTRCSNGAVPDYDCVRNGFSGRCERVNPRCGTATDAGPGSDSSSLTDGPGADGGTDDGPGDTAATDGGEPDGPAEAGP